jgi:hypothetical protein
MRLLSILTSLALLLPTAGCTSVVEDDLSDDATGGDLDDLEDAEDAGDLDDGDGGMDDTVDEDGGFPVEEDPEEPTGDTTDAERTLVLYMSPNGDDTRNGTSPVQAVKTLARVQYLIAKRKPTTSVDVAIAPGTYHAQTVKWTTTIPGRFITFRRQDPNARRPVFDGCTAAGVCKGGTFFNLVAMNGEPSRIRFHYLEVRRYTSAIRLGGDHLNKAGWNGKNRIYGCVFANIGNRFAPNLPYSTAAVRLVNSDDNEIANNHFIDIINTTEPGLIHALYLAWGADRNVIRGNRFLRSTGDAVRVRDFSNGNLIEKNRFTKVGTFAGYSDWFCDREISPACREAPPLECPSWNNRFRNNVLDGKWDCAPMPAFHYFQDGVTAGCSRPTGAVRLRTAGNKRTARACSL